MARRGELGEREAGSGQVAASAGGERTETRERGRIREKHPPPKAAGEKVENWKQPQGLN